MFSEASAEELRRLLTNFLADEPDSAMALRSFLKPKVNRLCARRAANLPYELREEVLQEALLILVGSGCSGYSSDLQTAPRYVYNAVRSALQSVRRRHGLTPSRTKNAAVDVELETISDGRDLAGKVEQSLLTNQIFRCADPTMRRILWRVYVNEEVQEAVLAEVKMTRFTLARKRRAIACVLSGMKKAA